MFSFTPAQNPHLELLLGKRPQKRLCVEENYICYSEFKKDYSADAFRNVGLKYVIEGVEYYKVNNVEHKVKEKHFLISHKAPKVFGFIDSAKTVKGICLDLSPKLIKETVQYIHAGNNIDFEAITSSESQTHFFFDHISFAKTSLLKKKLEQLEKHLLAHEFELSFVNEEWFMEIAEQLICEQNPKWLALNRLKSLKLSTKKEVMRRLLLGKEYMDLHFTAKPKIKPIAEFASLSQFHFFRAFKDAFGLTPHQYLLEKKLQYSRKLIATQVLSISDISIMLNFTDIHAFSNSFKKRFGFSPTRIAKSNFL